MHQAEEEELNQEMKDEFGGQKLAMVTSQLVWSMMANAISGSLQHWLLQRLQRSFLCEEEQEDEER